MMRLWWIVWVVACQPLGDTTGDLAAHGAGQRVYWQMKLDDTGVKKDRKFQTDERMPTKIHALRSMPHATEDDLTLTATQVNLNTTIDLANVIFSWHDQDNTYTCHLHDVSLGAQRDVIEGGNVKAALCFVQKKDEGDYVRLLADHCVSASANGESRFIFREGRDFACDLSDKAGDEDLVLQASCLAKGDTSCLNGKIRACAEQSEGIFPHFIKKFKEHIETVCKENDDEQTANCTIGTIKYNLKNEEHTLTCTIPKPAEQDNHEATETQNDEESGS